MNKHTILLDGLTFTLGRGEHRQEADIPLVEVIKRRGIIDTSIVVDCDLNVICGGELLRAAVVAKIRPSQIPFELRPGLTSVEKEQLVVDCAIQRNLSTSVNDSNQNQKENCHATENQLWKPNVN